MTGETTAAGPSKATERRRARLARPIRSSTSVEDFISTYLHTEVAYEALAPTRELLAVMSPQYTDSLKHGFEELLRQRELSVGDYDGMTHVEFSSDEALYGYLRGVYDFLFNGAEEEPRPPR